MESTAHHVASSSFCPTDTIPFLCKVVIINKATSPINANASAFPALRICVKKYFNTFSSFALSSGSFDSSNLFIIRSVWYPIAINPVFAVSESCFTNEARTMSIIG